MALKTLDFLARLVGETAGGLERVLDRVEASAREQHGLLTEVTQDSRKALTLLAELDTHSKAAFEAQRQHSADALTQVATTTSATFGELFRTELEEIRNLVRGGWPPSSVDLSPEAADALAQRLADQSSLQYKFAEERINALEEQFKQLESHMEANNALFAEALRLLHKLDTEQG